jgi:glutamate synthase (ferredoxin)
MMAIGCIQAQKCHTDHCPVGVATQNPRYTFGLDVELKSVRAANYIRSLRRDLLKVSEAVGVVHPGLITPWDIDILTGQRSAESLHAVYGYDDDWGAIGPDLRTTIEGLMTSQGEAPQPHPTTR